MRRIIPTIVAVAATARWTGIALADGDDAFLGDLALTEEVNIGSGEQVNANDWQDMFDVNAGGNQLTGGGINSNAGDRSSADVVLTLGDLPLLASTALDVEVVGIEISGTGSGSSADSSLTFSDHSGFTNSYGVTAVAINSGANASQSVSVNVMSEVTLVGAAGN